MKDNDRYSDVDICTLYRRGSSISILNQLTGKSNFEIKNILMNGGYIEMNNERKENILEKYKEGLSDVAIARATGYPQSQVSTFLRGQGLPANGKLFGGKAKKQEEKVAVVEEIKTDQPEVKQNDEKTYTYSPENGWNEIRSDEKNEVEIMKNSEKELVIELENIETKDIDWKVVSENLEKRIEGGQVKNDKYNLAYITLDIIREIWRSI
ncbi:MAG: hypothetical protein K0R54_2266 [Clostridiaceae bacterium]|nr:hypothetical protein [Clostridiaceae bacterium]